MAESEIKKRMRHLGLSDLKVDDFAIELLDMGRAGLERLDIDDIGLAASVLSRHALVVRLELNHIVGQIEYYKYKKKVAQTDDDIMNYEAKISNLMIRRNLLFDVPEYIQQYANSIKKIYDRKIAEMRATSRQ